MFLLMYREELYFLYPANFGRHTRFMATTKFGFEELLFLKRAFLRSVEGTGEIGI